VAREFAQKNDLVRNNRLSKMNNRQIYSNSEGSRHYSLDTQHGHFEVLDRKGRHQGSIGLDGLDTNKGIQIDHNIRVD